SAPGDLWPYPESHGVRAATVEGVPCYPDLGSIPGSVDGVIVATHADVSIQVGRKKPSGGAALSSRRITALLIAALLAKGCSSASKAERRAFLAAGLALQREAPEPSFDDLRFELDLYLNDELQDLKDRTKRQEEEELSLY